MQPDPGQAKEQIGDDFARLAGAAFAPVKPSPLADKASDLDSLKKTVDDAAAVGGGLWFSYLFVLFYLAVATGAVRHADLFFEKPVKLPFLNIELPLLAFFSVAPFLFLVVHAYVLLNLAILSEKTRAFARTLEAKVGEEGARGREYGEGWRGQLPSNVFVQALAGPARLSGGLFGMALRCVAWLTLVAGPMLLLLLFQLQFLPYHSSPITWTHRIALLVDLLLIWWLWGRIFHWEDGQGGGWARLPGRIARAAAVVATLAFALATTTDRGEPWTETLARRVALLAAFALLSRLWERVVSSETPAARWRAGLPWRVAGVAASAAMLTFSWGVATYFGEPWADYAAGWNRGSRIATWRKDLFESEVSRISRRRSLPLSDTLVLSGVNALDELGIADPKKAGWRDFLFLARGRHLEGAVLDQALLPRIDFTGAHLNGASAIAAQMDRGVFDGAHLEGADLTGGRFNAAKFRCVPDPSLNAPRECAELRDAIFVEGELDGADFDSADLMSADLSRARLAGAQLGDAQLDKAKLTGAKLAGARLNGASLQSAKLMRADLQAADLFGAHLEGADLSAARLQGANLSGAHLEGALLERTSLEGANLFAASLQGASLWVADAAAADFSKALLQGAGLQFAQLEGAILPGANLSAANLSDTLLWRSLGSAKETQRLLLSASDESWRPHTPYYENEDLDLKTDAWDQTRFDSLREQIESLPAGKLRDAALERIRRLDCNDKAFPSCEADKTLQPGTEFAAWRRQLACAAVPEAQHEAALAATLRSLVCKSGEDALAIARGDGFRMRLADAGPAAQSLLADLRDTTGASCEVAALLSHKDRAEFAAMERRSAQTQAPSAAPRGSTPHPECGENHAPP